MEDDRPPEWRNPNPQPEGLTTPVQVGCGRLLARAHYPRGTTSTRSSARPAIVRAPRAHVWARAGLLGDRRPPGSCDGASPCRGRARRRCVPPRARLGRASSSFPPPPASWRSSRHPARRRAAFSHAHLRPFPPSPPQTCLATALALAAFVFLEELSVFRDRVQALILAGARGGLTRASTDAGVVRTTARWSSTSHEWIRRAPGADDDAPLLPPPAETETRARASNGRSSAAEVDRPPRPRPPRPPPPSDEDEDEARRRRPPPPPTGRPSSSPRDSASGSRRSSNPPKARYAFARRHRCASRLSSRARASVSAAGGVTATPALRVPDRPRRRRLRGGRPAPLQPPRRRRRRVARARASAIFASRGASAARAAAARSPPGAGSRAGASPWTRPRRTPGGMGGRGRWWRRRG